MLACLREVVREHYEDPAWENPPHIHQLIGRRGGQGTLLDPQFGCCQEEWSLATTW